MLEYIQDHIPCYKRLLFPGRGLRIRASVTSVGTGRATGGDYDWDGTTRSKTPWTLLQYTIKGEGHLLHEGTEYTVPEQHAMLVTIPSDHRYYLPKGGEWEHFHFCFWGSEMTYFWKELIRKNGPVIHLPASEPIGQLLANTWIKLYKGKIETDYATSAAAYNIAMALAEYTEHSVYAENKQSEPVLRAREFVERHLSDPATGVDELAKVAGLSRHHFSRRFKVETGLAPGEYISNERLKMAVTLLQGTSDSILTISQNCGYRDPNYFARAFRKHFGISPYNYRNRSEDRKESRPPR